MDNNEYTTASTTASTSRERMEETLRPVREDLHTEPVTPVHTLSTWRTSITEERFNELYEMLVSAAWTQTTARSVDLRGSPLQEAYIAASEKQAVTPQEGGTMWITTGNFPVTNVGVSAQDAVDLQRKVATRRYRVPVQQLYYGVEHYSRMCYGTIVVEARNEQEARDLARESLPTLDVDECRDASWGDSNFGDSETTHRERAEINDDASIKEAE